MAKWTDDTPWHDGWYFWRKRSSTEDAFFWKAYFYCAEEREFFSEGVSVRTPQDGWWLKIEDC